MSSDGSVTQWLGQLKAGEQHAAQKLWERYFHALVGLARKRLQGAPRRAADEEDVALSAFHSFCHAAERGRFPQLHDRDDLWRLLVTITARKAFHQLRAQGQRKRGGRIEPTDVDLDQILGQEPSPDFAAQVAEECQRLLDHLNDADLRSIALWRMEGYTVEEITTKLNCSPSTIERRLRLIRAMWETDVEA
jgi:RNA polymerase sigma factor (sigma-70 family)